MDAPPTSPGPTPQTPYRAGKALAQIIPPDRRRLKAALLIGASMVAGIAVWELGGVVLEFVRGERVLPSQRPAVEPYGVGRIGPARLSGPGGTIALPPARRTVVNVWLQGCSDCMPAFEAMAKLEREGGLGVDVPVINVAYGEADLAWAQRYGVASTLVYDPGGANVVRPLGISTFTTLVVDPDGTIVHRDRPDRPAYAMRVRTALGVSSPPIDPGSRKLPPGLPAERDGVMPPPLDQAAVERVIVTHRAGIKRTCWDRRAGDDGRTSANVTVMLAVGPTGTVDSSSSNGDDPALAKCIEAQVQTWRFPASSTTTTINIPFKFVRE